MGGGNKDQKQGTDPRGTTTSTAQAATQRFNDQQGPLANAMGYNYGRASEANIGDYTDIMNQYRGIASGAGSSDGGGGGGGGGGYSAFTVTPQTASYKDPFQSYSGYQDFSKTGGFSDQDISNMRSRGTAPIRAAYSNAEREVARGRSLQGGYSPNAAAVQAKMAREQGQSMADASQNVEAGLAQQRQAGRLAGLGGMSGIETSRLGADVDLSKYNTGLNYQSQVYNADANTRAQAANNSAAASSAAQSMADRLAALRGMTSLYGTNPGMSETFGNQALNAVNMGGNFGVNMTNAMNNAQKLPGQFDQTMGRINDIGGLVSQGANAYGQVADAADERRRQNQPVNNPWQGPVNQPDQMDYNYVDENS